MSLIVAGIQFDIAWNDPRENTRRLHSLVQEAAHKRADLIVLPEMFSCGFSLCTDDEARAAHDIGLEFLRLMAKEHGCWIGGSMPSPSKTGFTNPLNTMVVVGPDGTQHQYSKTHLFRFGGEGQRYSAGEQTITFTIKGVRVTPFVCYDVRFPHLFSKAAPTTDLFLVVANWPVTRRMHWELLTRARAVENQCALLAVNRIGTGGGLEYQGDSRAYSATGEILFELGRSPEVGIIEINPAEIAAYREQFPVLKDRRADLGEAV